MCPNASTNATLGGCINQTGGAIQQSITATFAGTNTGLRENRTVDPGQLTNRKPPFFPTTQRFLENKYFEIDPQSLGSDAAVAAWFARLRG